MRISPSSVYGMITNNQWRQKCVIFAFVISQQIREIANGHEKWNRLMTAIFFQKLLQESLALASMARDDPPASSPAAAMRCKVGSEFET